MLTPTTQLEAVNLMLSVIGESPVNSLNDGASVDAVQAKFILTNTTRAVQLEGWWFNTETNIKLSPDTDSGEVKVPGNALKVDPSDKSSKVIARGSRLYDTENHTYKFSQPVEVDMVLFLPFEELPESARNYITVKAGRTFQERVLGSETLSSFSKDDERQARSQLFIEDNEAGDANMLSGSTFMSTLLGR